MDVALFMHVLDSAAMHALSSPQSSVASNSPSKPAQVGKLTRAATPDPVDESLATVLPEAQAAGWSPNASAMSCADAAATSATLRAAALPIAEKRIHPAQSPVKLPSASVKPRAKPAGAALAAQSAASNHNGAAVAAGTATVPVIPEETIRELIELGDEFRQYQLEVDESNAVALRDMDKAVGAKQLAEARAKAAEQAAAVAREQLAAAERARAGLVEELERMADSWARSKADAATQAARADELAGRTSSLESLLIEAEAAAAGTATKLLQAEADLEAETASLDEAKAELGTANETIKSLQDRMELAHDTAVAAAEAAGATHRELEEVRAALEEARAQLATTEEELASARSAGEAAEKAEKELAAARRRLADGAALQSQRDAAQAGKDAAVAAREEAQQRAEQLAEQLKAARREVEQLKAARKEAQQLKAAASGDARAGGAAQAASARDAVQQLRRELREAQTERGAMAEELRGMELRATDAERRLLGAKHRLEAKPAAAAKAPPSPGRRAKGAGKGAHGDVEGSGKADEWAWSIVMLLSALLAASLAFTAYLHAA